MSGYDKKWEKEVLALYHGLLKLPKVKEPMMPDPWQGVPGPDNPIHTGIKLSGK